MLTQALHYAESGLRVLPIHWPETRGCSCENAKCASPGKHPLTTHGVKDATTDGELIRYWWRCWPDANLAIATGNGIAVLDVDDLKACDRSRLWTRLAVTGAGLHAYYRVDRKVPNRTRARPGIDIRGEGGYVLAPPSVHETGVIYEWVHDVPAAPAPPWFYELCQDETPRKHRDGSPRKFDLEWIKPIAEGGRNDQLFRIACAAVAKGKDPALVEGEVNWINANRCTPPLPDREVEKLLWSALRGGR